MPKNRHHFVSQFYLRGFESAPRRINLCSVDIRRVIESVSIRDQCYRRKFYGQSNGVEDALATLENHAASVFREIQSSERLPPRESESHAFLLAFVALQVLRTTVVASRMNVHINKMTKQAHADDPRWSSVDLESADFGFDNPVLLSLRSLSPMLNAIEDLEAHLIISTERTFITSDNPAFRYNQYCEDIDYTGTAGPLSRGSQIFLPLSPRLHLMLYDPAVYSVPRVDRRSRRTMATAADVDALCRMQLVSAETNVYFSQRADADHIQRLLPEVHARRISDPVVVQEYGDDQDPDRSVLHSFERTPCLKLLLSFLKVRWRARSVALPDRVRGYRKCLAIPGTEAPAAHPGRTRATFARFIGRR